MSLNRIALSFKLLRFAGKKGEAYLLLLVEVLLIVLIEFKYVNV